MTPAVLRRPRRQLRGRGPPLRRRRARAQRERPQVDPAERHALAQLRSGKVDDAVSWYAAAGRIVVSPDRDTALGATVAGWAADAAKGTPAAMYAGRRANVAELNRRGREAWDKLGRLSGKELLVGEVGYRAGDRIVTLAPGAGGEIVTSE